MLLATKQAISIKLAVTVRHFLLDLDFANVYIWLDHLVLFPSYYQASGAVRTICLKEVKTQGECPAGISESLYHEQNFI